MKQELWKYSILEILKVIKKKIFTLELAKEIIKKINQDNPKLNAYVFFDEKIILEQASYPQSTMKKILHKGNNGGVPISIKDLIVTKNMPTYRGTFNIKFAYPIRL